MSRLKLTWMTLALTAAGSLAGLTVASAQSKLELNAFAGYNIASDIYNSYGATTNSHVGLDNGLIWGGRLTASSPHGGLEFAYSRASTNVTLQDAQVGQPRTSIGTVDVDMYDLNFLGYQPSGNPRVTPFGLIGFGWSVTHPTIDPDFIATTKKNPKSNSLFNFNFALGTKIEMNEKFGLRLEARWRVTDTAITTSSGIWCDPYGYCYSYASDWYNSGELIGGITYALR